jgi:sugar (pentulose or hexulose) kinase
MKKKYLIGVDGGSQSSKVVVFDLDGNIVCEGHQDLQPMHLAEGGVAEHPDDDLWDSVVVACRRAMQDFPGRPEEIAGLGVGSIRCCRVLQKEDGTLAAPVISWMDRRTAFPYDNANPDVRYVTATTGYVSRRFCGERVDTVSNYEGEWPIDRVGWKWCDDPETLKKYQIPREMLFELRMPGAIAGAVTEQAARVTGIPSGLPVATTANDKAVEALGAGLVTEDAVLISLGTYICGMAKGRQYVANASSFWTNLSSAPNQYLYESNGIRRGMWTVSWFKELLGDDLLQKAVAAGVSPEEWLEREASATPPGSDGLMTVLDWLAPPNELYRKGLFIGFDGRHKRGHMYRSILEAIAMTMGGHAKAMVAELGLSPKRVIVSGGGSNSDLFMQIFADVFGLPAQRNVVNAAAGLGAAICAGVATGAWPDFPTAVARMVRVRDSFAPKPENVRLYERTYTEVYQYLRSQVEPILRKEFAVFG